MEKIRTRSVLIFILLAGIGWIAFQFARQQKAHIAYKNADPYTWIPQKDTAVFLEIPGPDGWDKIKSTNLFENFDTSPGSLFPVVEALYSGHSYKKYPAGRTVIGFYPEGEILWHSVKPGEKERILRQIGFLFPAFRPVKEKIGNLTLYHYPLEENRFFSCFIEKSIFCGAFNRKVLLESLPFPDKNTSIAADSSFREARNRIGEFARAYVFLRIRPGDAFPGILASGHSHHWTAFDLDVRAGKLWASGYLVAPQTTAPSFQNLPSLSFDPHSFSSRIAYGYCNLPTASALSVTSSPALDSLLSAGSVLSINTFCFPSGHPDRRISHIKAFRLQSPETFRKKLSALLRTAIQPDSLYEYPPAVQTGKSENRIGLAFSGEYLYLSTSGDSIGQLLSDLREKRTLATLMPLDPWEQIGEDALLIAAGRSSAFTFLQAFPLPVSVASALRQTCFIAEFSRESPSSVYCNLCLTDTSLLRHSR